MDANHYSKAFKLRVATEACKPENEGLEHIIATTYHIRENTVLKWRLIYQQHCEAGFGRRNASVKQLTER